MAISFLFKKCHAENLARVKKITLNRAKIRLKKGYRVVVCPPEAVKQMPG
jgi:hypothetical protein